MQVAQRGSAQANPSLMTSNDDAPSNEREEQNERLLRLLSCLCFTRKLAEALLRGDGVRERESSLFSEWEPQRGVESHEAAV